MELASKLGVDQSYVSKIERGERRIDVLELRRVCVALDADLADFIEAFEKNLSKAGLP